MRQLRVGASALLGALSLLAAGSAQAQAPAPTQGVVTPKAQIVRISEAEAPKIDGVLDDAVWAKATQITDFRQMVPNYGSPPTERTVVYVAYDKDNFYLAVHAYDSEPDKLIVTQKLLDGTLVRDDSIHFYLDPDRTRRNAYSFELNAAGGYTDGLVQNSSDFLQTWNTIWAAAGQRVADGWTGEVAIPFRNLSFDPNNADWGFDFFRWIRRKNENVRWSGRPLGANDNDVSMTGTLSGFGDLDQGRGLDIQVYGAAKYGRYPDNSHNDAITLRASGNVIYKVTPALTALLTLNTDFSDTPLDAVQVNTTRFSLVQAETRQFFLQDAAAFEFGGRAFSSGFTQGSFNNGRPFFSRNIGLVSGQPVTIVAGGKVSGQLAGVSIGALAVQTHNPVTKHDEELSVLRLKAPVSPTTQIGMVYTNGDPTGRTTNSLAGGDLQYANNNFMGTRKRLQGAGYYLRTSSSTRGEDDSYGASVIYPNEPLGLEFHYKRIGDQFTPALGFANRLGINEYHATGVYRKRLRGASIRQYFFQIDNDVITDLDGDIESRENAITAFVERLTGDNFQGQIANISERVAAPFTVGGTGRVLAGDYTWTVVRGRIATSTNRPVSATIAIECCDYYNGRDYHTELDINWLPNETWQFTLSHKMDLIRLPTSETDIHIYSLTSLTNITPRMNVRTQLQYDNISQRFALLAQYRWEYEPGQELFFALGESARLQQPLRNWQYTTNNQQVILRLGHRFQF